MEALAAGRVGQEQRHLAVGQLSSFFVVAGERHVYAGGCPVERGEMAVVNMLISSVGTSVPEVR
jgi:hypothetical protein